MGSPHLHMNVHAYTYTESIHQATSMPAEQEILQSYNGDMLSYNGDCQLVHISCVCCAEQEREAHTYPFYVFHTDMCAPDGGGSKHLMCDTSTSVRTATTIAHVLYTFLLAAKRLRCSYLSQGQREQGHYIPGATKGREIR